MTRRRAGGSAARGEAIETGTIKVGYVVPEFPGQTHAFFWREIGELRSLGIEPVLISTRRPAVVAPHAWSAGAAAETSYLYPLGVKGALEAGAGLIRAGPRRVTAALRALREVRPGWGRSAALRWGVLVVAARLAAIARRRGLSHVHAHSCADAAVVAMAARALGGPTYSLTLHGHVCHYGSGQPGKWAGAAFGTVVAAHLIEQLAGAGVAVGKISVAPMGVDAGAFSREAVYVPATETGPVRLITCGRLNFHKGHQDVIGACAVLRGWGIDARAEVLGSGEYLGALQEAARQAGVEAFVEFTGAVGESEVRSRLERAHVYVSGSTDEAVGVATVEAMAMGLPVVATRVGGVPELVRDGRDGLLVEARDPERIAAAVRRIVESPGLAARMGQSGAERVRREYTSRRSAEVLAAGIRAACGGRGRSAGAKGGFLALAPGDAIVPAAVGDRYSGAS